MWILIVDIFFIYQIHLFLVYYENNSNTYYYLCKKKKLKKERIRSINKLHFICKFIDTMIFYNLKDGISIQNNFCNVKNYDHQNCINTLENNWITVNFIKSILISDDQFQNDKKNNHKEVKKIIIIYY